MLKFNRIALVSLLLTFSLPGAYAQESDWDEITVSAQTVTDDDGKSKAIKLGVHSAICQMKPVCPINRFIFITGMEKKA